jgi:hypothetical protein
MVRGVWIDRNLGMALYRGTAIASEVETRLA